MTSPTLREFDRLADRIKLHRQVEVGPVVVVEGISDKRFLESCIPLDVRVFVASTRKLVLEAAQEATVIRLRRVAFLVDRDFDHAVDAAIERGLPLVAYDSGDLEAMLLHTAAFTRLVEELGSEAKMEKAGGPQAVRSLITNAVRPIAHLRRANAERSWGLSFDKVAIQDRVDGRTLQLKLQPYCDALWNVSDGRSDTVTKAQVYEVFQTPGQLKCPVTGNPLVRGRDALAVLGVGMRRMLGSALRDQTGSEHLSLVLRLASGPSDVTATSWLHAVTQLLELKPQP